MYSIYIIICRLQEPEENYPELWQVLQTFPDHFNQQQGVWFVKSNSDTLSIRQKITAQMGKEDSLFVHKIVPSLSQGNMSDAFWKWLAQNQEHI